MCSSVSLGLEMKLGMETLAASRETDEPSAEVGNSPISPVFPPLIPAFKTTKRTSSMTS